MQGTERLLGPSQMLTIHLLQQSPMRKERTQVCTVILGMDNHLIRKETLGQYSRRQEFLHRHGTHTQELWSDLFRQMQHAFWMNIANPAYSFYSKTYPFGQKVGSFFKNQLGSCFSTFYCTICRNLSAEDAPYECWFVSKLAISHMFQQSSSRARP